MYWYVSRLTDTNNSWEQYSPHIGDDASRRVICLAGRHYSMPPEIVGAGPDWYI